jgi:hypothetical protein
MAPYVTVADYEVWAGTVADAARADFALEAACDAVRQYLCQQVDEVADDVVVLQGSGTEWLLLPEQPVTDVASVDDADGDPVTDWELANGALRLLVGWRPDVRYTVTYTHGWPVAEIPADIRMVTFRLARALYRLSEGEIRSESIGSYSVTYLQSSSGQSAADVVLSALDRRVVKQVPVP